MTAPAIELDGVGKRYRGNWGLRDCLLAIPAGRVVGLVGPNGAGKSTLLNLMIGLLDPTEGTVRLLGGSVAQARGRVAYLDQQHSLYRTFTVADMLKAGRQLNQRWDQQVALDRLAEFGIPLDRKVGKLSGGQQAQVALALAFARQPELLLMDEPVASLDPLARREFMGAVMSEVADRGTTVVVSSHVVSELELVCDYLVVLTGGQVRVAGVVEDLLAQHRRLIGPTESAAQVAATQDVVHRNDSDGRTTLLVRSNHGVANPSWQNQELNLEDLVLSYLSVPVVTPATPRLGVVA